MRKFIADKTEAGKRADIFVASKYPTFTRSSLGTLFEKKMIQIDSVAAKPSQRLKAGDQVSVDEALLKAKPPKNNLPILYQDDDLLVIDKPAGVLTHSKGALNLEATVASFIQPFLIGFEGTNRDGIVHRLDRDTSGLIICAKNPASQKYLQGLFSRRKVKKTYMAIVEGELLPQAAVIHVPIMRNPAKPQTFKVGASGRSSVTEYKSVRVFEKSGKKYSLVELLPATGRTHQLRVHLSYIRHPIVGDKIYGHPASGLMLHACGLELNLSNNQRMKFNSRLPERIKDFSDVR